MSCTTNQLSLLPDARHDLLYHRHRVELLQTCHSLKQDENQPSAFYRFNSPGKQIRCHCFEVLQNTHPVCITKYLVCLLVIDIANILRTDEEFERILGVGLPYSSFDFFLDFGLTFLSMTGI